MKTAYRADIDGLRAVAVVPVVLFHAGLGFPGGYIGVDIFFVISGYLISLGLFKSNEDGSYSLLSFYERRIRRIIPALTVMLLAVLAAGCLLLLPSELEALGTSTISAAAFYSNVYFWQAQNYFAGSNITKPLLHTWSLAVEEQFYIFWPLCVWAIYRLNLRRHRIALILAAACVSLSLAELLLYHSPKTAFYMFPLRAWELLAGALLATGVFPRIKSRPVAEVLSVAAIGMIAWSVFALNEESRFPGLAAIPSVLGSVLLIHVGASRRATVTRILSLPPLVAIGLISYSLYLWHWPILSLFTIVSGASPDPVAGWALVALSLLAAWLSWYFVELPFRTGKASRRSRSVAPSLAEGKPQPRLSRNRVLASGAGAIAAASLLGSIAWAGGGFPSRLNGQARAIDSHRRQAVQINRGCIVMDEIPGDFVRRCLGKSAGAPIKVAVWGDSFARQYVNDLGDRYRARGVEPLFLIATGCTPLPGATAYFGKGRADARCSRFKDRVLATLLRLPELEQVIIAGRWSNLGGMALPGERSSPAARYLTDSSRTGLSLPNSLAVMRDSLARTIGALQGRGVQVTLLKEPPRYAKSVPPCAARASWMGRDILARCGTTTAVQRSFRAPLDAIFRDLQSRFPRVTVYDPLPFLCSNGVCLGYDAPVLVTEDVDHLSREGSTRALRGLDLPMPHSGKAGAAGYSRP